MEHERASASLRKKSWSRDEAVVPVLFLSYCLAYILQTYHLPKESTKYPYILIVFVVTLFVWVIYKHVFLQAKVEGVGAESEKEDWHIENFFTDWKKLGKPASILVATFVNPYVMTVLGFTLTNALFLAVLFWIFGVRRISTILGLSLGFSLFIFFIMTYYLKIILPPFALVDLPFGL